MNKIKEMRKNSLSMFDNEYLWRLYSTGLYNTFKGELIWWNGRTQTWWIKTKYSGNIDIKHSSVNPGNAIFIRVAKISRPVKLTVP